MRVDAELAHALKGAGLIVGVALVALVLALGQLERTRRIRGLCDVIVADALTAADSARARLDGCSLP